MKKLIPAYILALVICFMLFIYEPITMYANNINVFWFDFKIMIKPMLSFFMIILAVLLILYTLIYEINKKTKKPIYNVSLIISFIAFIASYIQGNYLVKNLPPLDGTIINWGGHTLDNIITLVIWIILITIYIITIKKYKYEKVINTSKYISLAIFGMLITSLATTMLTKNIYQDKLAFKMTYDNYNLASTDKNLFILLLDAVDQKMFDAELQKSENKNLFDDFTFYSDTLSGYPFTRDSIPFIFSGEWNNNEKDFSDYCNISMDNSKFIKQLEKENYTMNIYDDDLCWKTTETEKVSNIKRKTKDELTTMLFGKQEIKYALFKYLPYKLKKYSKIENMKFVNYYEQQKYYNWSNQNNYHMIDNKNIKKQENKVFNYLHLEGGHVPFDIDENLNYTENGTYEQKLAANIKIIKKYLDRLKENDVYDNSAIVILADHGYSYTGVDGRQNPILYIKVINEHHKMYTSDKQISHQDLSQAFVELIEGKTNKELFKNISDKRTRKYNWYEYTKENHMIEQQLDGKAWEQEKMIPTGKEFNR